MGCAFGTSPMFSCEKRSWMCCMGNVYEFAEANPLTMKFYDFEQGAACMICCASAVLSHACIALVRLLGLRCKAPYVPAAKVWELCWRSGSRALR